MNEKILSKLINLKKATNEMKNAISQDLYSPLERAGLIKTFDFSLELLWKTLKAIIENEGFQISGSPKEVIRQAISISTISLSQGEVLIESLNQRNILSHVYNSDETFKTVEFIKNIYAKNLIAIEELLSNKYSIK